MHDLWEKWLTDSTCFFFDLDGTLIDSNMMHEQAFLMTIASIEDKPQFDFKYDNYKGMKTSDVFTKLGFNKERVGELTEEKQRCYRECLKEGKIAILPFAIALLRTISGSGYNSYLITGSSRSSVEMMLRNSEIGFYIRDYVCGDDIVNSKPDPEIYLLALNTFNVHKQRTLAIEDSRNGIQSAIRAGIKTITVLDDYQHQMVQQASLENMYHHLVPSLHKYTEQSESKGFQ